MTLFIGSLQLGLIYGFLAIGIYISFRIMNIPDLTAEGSFTFGLVVAAVFADLGHPILGIVLALAAGALAGVVTGALNVYLRIPAILAGILTMSGLYSVNLLTMDSKANLTLIGVDTIFSLTAPIFGGDLDLAKTLVNLVLVALAATSARWLSTPSLRKPCRFCRSCLLSAAGARKHSAASFPARFAACCLRRFFTAVCAGSPCSGRSHFSSCSAFAQESACSCRCLRFLQP